MARARTTKQGLALAFGKYRYSNPAGGVDMEQQERRRRKQAEAEAKGLRWCWNCEEGSTPAGNICEHCGADEVPF